MFGLVIGNKKGREPHANRFQYIAGIAIPWVQLKTAFGAHPEGCVIQIVSLHSIKFGNFARQETLVTLYFLLPFGNILI